MILAFLLAAFPLAAAGERPAAEQEKIDWLLSEIRGSDAVFVRNGKEHDGQQAAAHLKSKLWWAGKRVQTAREFIVGVASHSEASGQPYQIKRKDGTRELLEKWLLQRLAVFEEGAKARKPAPGA
jgi:Family of unknown function (DUF5329)